MKTYQINGKVVTEEEWTEFFSRSMEELMEYFAAQPPGTSFSMGWKETTWNF